MVGVKWSNGHRVTYQKSNGNWIIRDSKGKKIGSYKRGSSQAKALTTAHVSKKKKSSKKKSSNSSSNGSSSSSGSGGSSSSDSSSSTSDSSSSSTDTSSSADSSTSDSSSSSSSKSSDGKLRGTKLSRLPKKERKELIKSLLKEAKSVKEYKVSELDTAIQKEQPSYLKERKLKKAKEKAKTESAKKNANKTSGSKKKTTDDSSKSKTTTDSKSDK